MANNHLIIPSVNRLYIFNPSTQTFKYTALAKVSSIDESFTATVIRKENAVYLVSKGALFELDAKKDSLVLLARFSNYNSTSMIDASGVLWWKDLKGVGIHMTDLQTPGFRSHVYKINFAYDFFAVLQRNILQKNDPYAVRVAKDTSGAIWLKVSKFLQGKRRGETGGIVQWNKDINLLKFGGDYSSYGAHALAFSSNNDFWMVVERNLSQMKLVKVNLLTNTLVDFADLKQLRDEKLNIHLSASGTKLFYSDGYELQIFDTATKRSLYFAKEKIAGGSTILMTLPDHDNKDLLWIATYGSGIIKLHISTGVTERLTEKDGIPQNTVYYIARDKHGYFWCSSNKGIFRFDPKDNSVVSFTVKDGLQGNEFNRYHFLETPDGHFIFGGTAGYTIFHPDSVYIDQYQTPIVITGIKINNNILSDLPEWKDSAVANRNFLEVAYNQNFISISFAGLQFNNLSKLKYRYMLENFDKNWVEAGSLASASYTNIPPGEYTFIVNCSNTIGKWSNKMKTLVITVRPPWWKTVLAYTFYLLVSGCIVYALYQNGQQRTLAKQKIISKDKEAAQLKAVDEMKSRFFSNITHEFRTPLSLIIAPLEQLKNNNDLPQQAHSVISVVQRNAQQLQRLINQLLDMSKIESGNMKIILARGELDVFILDCVQSFIPYAEAKNIQLKINLENVQGEYEFDADKLQKILANLVSNAIKFSQAGNSVEVSVKSKLLNRTAEVYIISVKDTGIGISKETMPFLFNRFYQADDSPTRQHEGTGIGLALVKELTELLGGQIQVESEQGHGAIFSVTFPLEKAFDKTLPVVSKTVWTTDEENSEHKILNPVMENVGKPLILIVEDNSDLKQFIASVFQNDYKVITAGNGIDGLLLAHQDLPDVIVSDVMMPKMDGYTFCNEIKNNPLTDHIAFVMLTAKVSHESVIKGLKSNADDYIIKPFHVDELALRIRNILERQEKLKIYYQRQLASPEPETNEEPVVENLFLKQLYTVLDESIDDRELTVETLARKVNLGQRTLYRKLDSLLGLTPNEVIRQYRLKKAVSFLTSGLTIMETAYKVGYDTLSWFSTSFKNFYHVTPSEFVKRLNERKDTTRKK